MHNAAPLREIKRAVRRVQRETREMHARIELIRSQTRFDAVE